MACRSLAIFVQSLEGMRVVVELKTDAVVRGTLDLADDYMNLTMSDVSLEPLQRPKQRLPFLYVKARHVRYVHLPGSIDPERSVAEYRKRQHAALHATVRAAQGAGAPKGAPSPNSATGSGDASAMQDVMQE